MPTLNWIGKNKVVNHHLDVPYRILEKKYTYKDGAIDDSFESENKIIHGDNLEALKSLLPEYEGKIKCIYIDPPYNTGNEDWVYNDNVNDPKIKKWLGKVVGKEFEDFSRHDKWLCMMYPRLKLLQKLLAKDGIVIISIDDTEYCNLKYICDEIFSSSNYIATIVWKKRYQGAKEKRVVVLQEYALMYAKDINDINNLFIPSSEALITRNYKYKDDLFEIRGPYRTQPLEAGNSMEDRENLREPIKAPDGSYIYPRRQWIWEKERIQDAINHNEIGFNKVKGQWNVFIKQYLINRDGTQRMTKPFSIIDDVIIDDVYTQNGTKEMLEIFNDGNKFPFPKPSKYIEELITMAYRDKDAIILDSFAGSGTTAHAVLNLNKIDGGNRKFILIEMMDYAETLTAERIKKVIKGYKIDENIETIIYEKKLTSKNLKDGQKYLDESKKVTENNKNKFDKISTKIIDNTLKVIGVKTSTNKITGIGGDFSYYELGSSLLLENGFLNEDVPLDKILEYIWFTETQKKKSFTNGKVNHYYLGKSNGVGYWFYYEKNRKTEFDLDFLQNLSEKCEQYIVYADVCLLEKTFMQKNNIIFKKIPRDIQRF